MSCHPGNPCYGTTTVVDPCVTANGSSSNCCDTILYCGPALPNTGIDNLETLCLALQKIDAEFSNIQVNVTANNGLTKTGDNIQLGGPLVKSATITTNNYPLSIIGLPDDPDPDYIVTVSSTGVLGKSSGSSLGQTITLANNVGLVWTDSPTNSNLSTLYNTTIADSTVSVEVGGAVPTAASVWKTKSLVEVLDTILFPLRLPTYVVPTVTMTLTPSTSSPYEIGSTINVVAIGVGNKWDAGAFASLSISKTVNSGTPTVTSTTITSTTGIPFGEEFPGLPDPNSPNIVYTSSPYSETLTIPAPSSGQAASSVTYQFSGAYGQGIRKKQSNGVDDTRAFGTGVNNPQLAGTATSAPQTFTGIYPFYWGLSDTKPTVGYIQNAISTGVGSNKIVLSASGTITVPFNTSVSKYFWVAHPSVYTTKTKWFVNVSNFGNIGSVTDLFGAVQTGNVNSAPVSAPLWTGINYKMYISNYDTILTDNGGNMELRNS
jgi:hypothetical protein